MQRLGEQGGLPQERALSDLADRVCLWDIPGEVRQAGVAGRCRGESGRSLARSPDPAIVGMFLVC